MRIANAHPPTTNQSPTECHMNEEDTRLSSMDSAILESCVRGHHIYKAVWSPFVGEELVCLMEDNNSHDQYAVCVLKSTTIVGHVPRKISAACSLSLQREDSSITYTITGSRCYSSDLPRGLEVPCILKFHRRVADVGKIVKLLYATTGSEEPPSKKKIEPNNTNNDFPLNNTVVLSQEDRRIIIDAEWLTNIHINAAQKLLKRPFRTVVIIGCSEVERSYSSWS